MEAIFQKVRLGDSSSKLLAITADIGTGEGQANKGQGHIELCVQNFLVSVLAPDYVVAWYEASYRCLHAELFWRYQWLSARKM